MSEKKEAKIRELEERLEKIDKNKQTEKSISYIKSQIATLRKELMDISQSSKGGGVTYAVRKSGDAQVAFIGFPSVGKSSLLNELTGGNTQSKVAQYEFTTLRPIPGMMQIHEARIQLIDLPGIILGAASGKGEGKQILSAARSADLILIVVSYDHSGQINFENLEKIRDELFNAAIRLNDEPPDIDLKTTQKGGITVSFRHDQEIERDTVAHLLREFGYRNANMFVKEPEITVDRIIDHILGNRVYTKELIVINKADLASAEENEEEITEKVGHTNWIKVSATEKFNINELKELIFEKLQLIRIYLKPPRKEADMDEPIILKRGASLKTLCEKLHRDFVKNYRYAMVWGDSAKHDGQRFRTMKHKLMDGDIVSIYTH